MHLNVIQLTWLDVISGSFHEVDVNCTLLCYLTASDGNNLPTFVDDLSLASRNPISFGFLNAEEGTDRLSRNVGNKLSLLAV